MYMSFFPNFWHKTNGGNGIEYEKGPLEDTKAGPMAVKFAIFYKKLQSLVTANRSNVPILVDWRSALSKTLKLELSSRDPK